jgi:SAM-dependent MidA family methyltransferase
MVSPLDRNSELQRLPPLSGEEQRHSEGLTRLITGEIERAGGIIEFSRYMELALYAPGLGYYASGRQKFGEAGDFVTAPELGSLFARCVAHQAVEILNRLGGGSVLEAGAGSGALAADLLTEMRRLGCLPDSYLILETSASLQAHQRETLSRQDVLEPHRVEWLQAWPEGFRGIVIANELLDALPVQRFCITENGIHLLGVGWDGAKFFETTFDEAEPGLGEQFAAFDLPLGYISEWHPQAHAWVRSVADTMDAGVVVVIDYGFPAHEFYHRDRSQGTLMCHFRHRAHADPYVNVGIQDITTHIDFSAIASAGRQADLEVLGYTQQAAFLLSLGLTQLADQEVPESAIERVTFAQQIKKLMHPSEMGELFKVIALGKGVAPPLTGFQLSDHRGRL